MNLTRKKNNYFNVGSFLTVAFIVLCKLVNGQLPKHHIYDSKDGLTCKTIYNVIEDRNHFLWIATDNGVYKFDGQEFKRYSTENGLPDNDCHSVNLDNTGRIWVLCYNANICYIENDRVFSKKNCKAISKIDIKYHWVYCCNFENFILFYETESQRKIRIYKDNSIEYDQRKGSFFETTKYVILHAQDGISAYSKQNKLVAFYKKKFEKNDVLVALNPTTFLLFSGNKKLKLVIKNNSFIESEFANQTIDVLNCISMPNLLWSKENSEYISPFTSDLALNEQIRIPRTTKTINNIYQDFQGGYWVSLRSDKLIYYPKTKTKIYSDKSGLLSNVIESNHGNHEEFFITNDHSSIQHFTKNGIQKEVVSHGYSGINYVSCIATTKFKVVCGTNLGNTCIYDRKKKEIFHLPKKIGSYKQINVINDSLIICSTSSSALILNLNTYETVQFYNARSISAHRMPDNTLFVGTIKGIQTFKCDKKFKRFRKIQSPYPGIKKVSSYSISSIRNINDLLIVSTSQNGLFILSKNKTLHLTTRNGLVDNNCKGIYIQNDSTFWVSSSSGVSIIKFNNTLNSIKVKKLTQFNSLLSSNIQGIYFISNRIYLISLEGITSFDKSEMEMNQVAPKVFINNASYMNNRQLKVNARGFFQTFSRSVVFSFSAIDYRSEGNFKYAYRLIGLHDKWQLSTNKEITLERLIPKKYMLEVKALNAFDKWSAKPAKFTFEILPVWHEKIWVRICFVLLFLAGIGWLMIYILKRKYKRKNQAAEQRKHISEIELKAIKAQINPHFIFNTLNAIQYFIQNHENEKADTYLSRMSRLIRTTLNFSNESSISLAEEVEYLRNYLELESLRFDDDFSYDLICTFGDELDSFQLPTMVLQPHIENAIRHGLKPKKEGQKHLEIHFSKDDYFLICKIQDNGIGRNKSYELNEQSELKHTSHGDSLSKEKLAHFKLMYNKNASIEIIDLNLNDKPAGTCVLIKIEL